MNIQNSLKTLDHFYKEGNIKAIGPWLNNISTKPALFQSFQNKDPHYAALLSAQGQILWKEQDYEAAALDFHYALQEIETYYGRTSSTAAPHFISIHLVFARSELFHLLFLASL